MRSVITVREQLVEVNGRIVAGAPKTQSGVRVVEIGERVIEALHLRGRDRPALSYVTKLLGKLVRAAGVRPGAPARPPHGAASLMLAQGVPMAVISKRLGHSSVGITSDIYSHLHQGVGASAAAATGAAVRPRATTRTT